MYKKTLSTTIHLALMNILVARISPTQADRYWDRGYDYYESYSSAGIGGGIILVVGLAWLSFAVSDLRWVGYIVGGCFSFMGLVGEGGALLVGAFLIAASAAGSYMERKK
jgi:hypothetical protein